MKYRDVDLETIKNESNDPWIEERIIQLKQKEKDIEEWKKDKDSEYFQLKMPAFWAELDTFINEELYNKDPYLALRKALSKMYKLEKKEYVKKIVSYKLDCLAKLPSSDYKSLDENYLFKAITVIYATDIKKKIITRVLKEVHDDYISNFDSKTEIPYSQTASFYKYDLISTIEKFLLLDLFHNEESRITKILSHHMAKIGNEDIESCLRTISGHIKLSLSILHSSEYLMDTHLNAYLPLDVTEKINKSIEEIKSIGEIDYGDSTI